MNNFYYIFKMNIETVGLLVLLFIIVLVILVYFVYFKDPTKYIMIQEKPVFLVDDVNLKYSATLMPESLEGEKYTFSFWVNVNNIPENGHWDSDVNIPKGIISHFDSPSVYYLVKEGILRISIGYKNKLGVNSRYNINLRDFKYQIWQNVIIVVNNKQVDVYLNGKLTKSILLPNIPWISNDNLYIGQAGNNFFGHVALVEYVNDALSTNKVEELYDKNKNSSELEKELITYSEYYKEKMSKK
tara:strand:+ start:3566 stop:4294 length:729 start_codon:yes stop_codon:yes gene_type:complete